MHTVIGLAWCLALTPIVLAQNDGPPSVLIVTAHPDDEALFAGSIYRLTQEVGGTADLALVTDGAGGYRYSTLAENLYGMELTDPEVAREYLPAIRKKELLSGGAIIGLRKYFFLDQPDTGRTPDPDSILATVWDSRYVTDQLVTILQKNDYDFLLVFLPLPDSHGHHKAAALLGIRAAKSLESDSKPVVLGAWISSEDDSTALEYHGLEGYPDFRATSVKSLFRFDRTHPIVGNDRLNYKIPANWLIAEHKSQGTMQLFMNRGDYEEYWIFSSNDEDAQQRAERYFELLNTYASE